MTRTQQDGFTLPVILMISLTLLIIGLASLQTISAVRFNFESRYYTQLANEAAEAGVTRATYCLKNNNYQQTWGTAQGNPPLTQSTDCQGNQLSPAFSSIISAPGVITTFSIDDLEVRDDGAVLVAAQGSVSRLVGGSAQVLETYNRTIKKSVKPPDVKLGRIALGYYNYNGTGAYFATYGSDGSFRTAGSNNYGELGNGTTQNTLVPGKYILPAGKIADKAYSSFLAQGFQLFVQTTDGDLYGSGYGANGQLGNGQTNTINSTPQKFQLPNGEKATYVGPNGEATFVITDASNIYAAGSCANGMLGSGTCTSGNVSTPVRVALPTPNVSDPNTIPDNEIATDYNSAFVRMKGGRVYGWGNNSWGELARGGTNTTGSNIPLQIGTFGDSGQPKATNLSFDGDTIYIVDSNGDAWAVGRNDNGQMGIGSTTSWSSLKKVQIPGGGGKVIKSTTDQWFVSFLTDTGNVYSVGINAKGQLGNGAHTTRVTSPSSGKFILPSGVVAVDIWTTSVGTGSSQNYNNTFVVGSDGKVYAAGSNYRGQLGIGSLSPSYRDTAIAMSGIDGLSVRAISLQAGFGSVIITTDTNRIFTVGDNTYGQLGDGTTNLRTTPDDALFLRSSTPTYVF